MSTSDDNTAVNAANTPDPDDGYVDSPNLTAAQNAKLRSGKLPGELKLEAIQLFLGLFALILAIVALVIGFRAMGMVNDLSSQLEEANATGTAITKQLDSVDVDAGGENLTKLFSGVAESGD